MANQQPRDILPLIILIAIVSVMMLGVWLFPRAANFLDRQNCVASGRTDCG
ncbi:MAG TPA: hypothetical protein VGC26_09505 [Afipia sp.]